MLRCTRCGWEQPLDIVRAGGDVRCRNCGLPVRAEALTGRNLQAPGVRIPLRPGP